MKLVQINLKQFSNILSNSCQIKHYSSGYSGLGTNEEHFPYTSKLYKKNYIKYPVQSQSAIAHDYIFHGEERLPSYDERIKDFKNPYDEIKKNIGNFIKKENYKFQKIKDEIDTKWSSNKAKKELELAAKELRLNVPIDKIEEQYKKIFYFKHIEDMANHYNIYKDLFEQGFFQPIIDLNIEYKTKNDDKAYNVYYGNRLAPSYTTNKPTIKLNDLFECYKNKNTYHSLLFINLDGNFQNSNNEVILWFLANVKNGDFNGSGKELVDYMQPFPMRGTGWHRCVYLLFEHKEEIDFKLNLNNDTLFSKRNFKTSEFYLNNQQNLVPVGLAFFQANWDLSVKNVFYEYFKMKEPIYEYDFGPRFLPKFEKYPKDQIFNWYLQDYTDKKQLNEEVMKDYLKNLSPFEYYPKPSKYPLLDIDKVKPRWYKYEAESQRKRKHQYSIIPYKHSSIDEKFEEKIKSLPYQQK